MAGRFAGALQAVEGDDLAADRCGWFSVTPFSDWGTQYLTLDGMRGLAVLDTYRAMASRHGLKFVCPRAEVVI